MKREHGKSINDICENDIVTKGTSGKRTTDSHTTRIQSSELTGSDGVMIRRSRAAAVVFVLLCVLLLTARIILCATFTQERQQLLTMITNLTEERDQLLTKITNLTERQQLQTNNMNLTEERQELLTTITKLTEERDQLLTNNMKLTEERRQLKTKITSLAEEKDQLKSERNDLQKKCADGWRCHQSSLYFISSEKKNWDESRRYCRERGADLIIINNREEQDFVKIITGSFGHFWIGLTDVEVEGRWKWVDGSTLTSGFWAPGEPNSFLGTDEDCATTLSIGWVDSPCDNSVKWICEKSILK
ncbi:CD209 antigen-like protein C [Carassius gibelio]|uniref:CD209 antigen-like protein C n=1 Tax=Carassius gibelio TaxID=101364 RepID=UPI0022782E3C|nr:CD209 antigen-like protein C [Carassius gibelio]